MENPGRSNLGIVSKVAPTKPLKGDRNHEFSNKVVNSKEQVGFQRNHRDGLISDFVGGGGLAVPAIFPEEVWEMILNEVVKAEDIYSVLLAFPELNKAFQKKKADWLFGAVLPHLMTKHLVEDKFEDLSNLRRVSKRWNASVKSSLESHLALQHLPVPPLSLKDVQKVIPSENHFNYSPFQEPKFGASIFGTGQEIQEFLTSMTSHSGNPFPGSYVVVTVSNSNIDESLALFEKFGEHVLFLEMELDGDSKCHLELCKNVLKCLSHLPNLRSLSFTGELYRFTDHQTSNYFSKPESHNLFPDLPNLEAFNCQNILKGGWPSRWTTQMIQKYGSKNGLGKLGISVSHCSYIPSNLATITELMLLGGRSKISCLDFTKHVFNKLSSPLKLRKLYLQNWGMVNINDLINFLAGFKVETLILEEASLYYCKAMGGAVEATSVTSLHLSYEHGVNCDFVKGLPNLQYLSIHFELDKRWGWRAHFKEGIKPNDSLTDRIKGFVMKTCDKNVKIAGNEQFSIWKELPKLKMLSVRVTQESRLWDYEASVWNVQFVRECGDKPVFGCCSDDDGVLYEDAWDGE